MSCISYEKGWMLLSLKCMVWFYINSSSASPVSGARLCSLEVLCIRGWKGTTIYVICLVAALCCRRVTLSGSCWQPLPHTGALLALAQPQRVSQQQSSSETAQHPPAGCCQQREGIWDNPRPTHLVGIICEWARAALSSCSASGNAASISPWRKQKHLADKSHQAEQQSSWESPAAGSLSFTWSSLHSCELLRPCFIS